MYRELGMSAVLAVATVRAAVPVGVIKGVITEEGGWGYCMRRGRCLARANSRSAKLCRLPVPLMAALMAANLAAFPTLWVRNAFPRVAVFFFARPGCKSKAKQRRVPDD